MQNQQVLKLNFFILSILFFFYQQLDAQITIGDIAFTGYNSSPNAGSDDFSFIILKTGGLPANSVINFTDCGWNSSACGNNGLFATNGATATETDIAWTSPNSVLAYGTQVRISALTATQGTVTGTTISLSGIGDQLFAFTGSRTSPAFIAGIQMNVDAGASASNWDNLGSGVTSVSSSNRPPCLTDGTYSVWFSVENDNAVFDICSLTLSTTKATALTQVNNASNWSKADGTAFSLPKTCPLPVELLSFQAKDTEGGTLLTWQTASEKNNAGFYVQRSVASAVFNDIAFIKGSGTTLETQNYSFIDEKPLNTTAYYRLKQEDYDGKANYSNIVSIEHTRSSKVKIYPALRYGDLTVEGAESFMIYNTNGQVVFKQPANTGNIHTLTHLASGIYVIKGVDTEGGTFSRKINVIR